MMYGPSAPELLWGCWFLLMFIVVCGMHEDVQHQTPNYRLVVDRNRYSGDSYRVQRKVGRRWKTVARRLDHSDGYWLTNRLQWPRV
jgi:hypothetical protein